MRCGLALAATTTAVLMLALTGCGKRGGGARGGPGGAGRGDAVTVTLTPVKIQPMQRSVGVVGTLYGEEEAAVSAKVSGRVVAIFKDIGDIAAPGETLAQIEKTEYDLAVKQKETAVREQLAKLGLSELPPADYDTTRVPTVVKAKLQADNAYAKYMRGKQLHDQKPPLLSDQDFADLQTDWEVARSGYDVEMLTAKSVLVGANSKQADLEIARQTLADTAVCAPEPSNAPAPGVERRYAVSGRLVSVGEYVKEGTVMLRVIADNPIKLRAAVPERYAAELKVGQKVKVSVEEYTDEFPGEVSRINPQIDLANRTFQIEVQVPNEKHLLKAGAFARAAIATRQDEKVVFAPLESIVSFAGTNKVFVVNEQKTAQDITVELGERDADWVEVIGMKGDEKVVVTGQNKLARGTKVLVKTAAELNGETPGGPTTRGANESARANRSSEEAGQ